MRVLIFILLIIGVNSCNHNKDSNNYSENFKLTLQRSGIELKADSLIFPKSAGIEPILIPTILELNKNYLFLSESGLEIKIRRTNFTDLEFELKDKEIIEKGTASLRPTFYLGAESDGTSEGEFWVYDYEIIDSNCIYTIRIGNQELTDEEPRELYLFINLNLDCDTKTLKDTNGIWKLIK